MQLTTDRRDSVKIVALSAVFLLGVGLAMPAWSGRNDDGVNSGKTFDQLEAGFCFKATEYTGTSGYRLMSKSQCNAVDGVLIDERDCERFRDDGGDFLFVRQ